MKPKKTHTQAIHVQSHDWATENQQLRKELLAREKRIEALEAMASTLNNQLSEKIDPINDMMQKRISFTTAIGFHCRAKEFFVANYIIVFARL